MVRITILLWRHFLFNIFHRLFRGVIIVKKPTFIITVVMRFLYKVPLYYIGGIKT